MSALHDFTLVSPSCLPLHCAGDFKLASGPPTCLHLSPTCVTVHFGCSECLGPHDFELVSHLSPTTLCILCSHDFRLVSQCTLDDLKNLVCVISHLSPRCLSLHSGWSARVISGLSPACLHLSPSTLDALSALVRMMCPYCDFTTLHQAQLTRHLRKEHKVAFQFNQFLPLRDALAGQPQCTHCGTKLAKGTGLQRHIVHNHCMLFDCHRPLQDCLADHPVLRELAAQQQWAQNEALLEQLRQCCSLCGLRRFSRKTLVEHLHREHGPAWNLAQPFVATLAAQVTASPCEACGHEGKRAHACPVIRQVALIQALHDADMQAKDLTEQMASVGNQLVSPSKRARQNENRSKPALITFQPARDAADGEPQCAHCGVVSKTMYILRRHIEDGYCKQFDEHRAMGGHIPSTWPWLLRQALLNSETTKATLSSYCVLCGQHLQRSGAVLPHIQNDHGQVLERAMQMHPQLIGQLQAEAKCHCTSNVLRPEHHCPVHHQILLLHYIGTTSPPTTPSWQAADFLAMWESPERRASLTDTCSICKITCGNQALSAHLQSHAGLLNDAETLLPLAQSPYMDCCDFCLQAIEPPDCCPVALNLCAPFLSNGLRPSADDRGGPDGRHRRILGKPAATKAEKDPRRSRSSRTATATDSRSHPTGTTPRESASSSGHGRPIHIFFAVRSKGHPPDPLPGHQTVEGAPDAKTDDYGSCSPRSL